MGADEKQADDQGWLVEQRYRAVLEVLDGSPASEVAVRYGVSRQSVYSWKARHAAAGIDGLRESSRRPRTSPSRLAAETEALVCELRSVTYRMNVWGQFYCSIGQLKNVAAASASQASLTLSWNHGGSITKLSYRFCQSGRKLMHCNASTTFGSIALSRPASILSCIV